MKLVWYRRDLRTKDHRALARACSTGEPVIALFLETPVQWQKHSMAPRQADLIYRRLISLRSELAKLNIPLVVDTVEGYADCADYLIELCAKYKVSDVFCTKDYEVNELKRDESVATSLNASGVGFFPIDDKCIFAPGSLVNNTGGAYRVFTPFKKSWLRRLELEGATPLKLPNEVDKNDSTIALLSNPEPIEFHYPRVESLSWPVDDAAVIQRMRDFCSYRLKRYQKLRDYPGEDATSLLSPYLAIGALSPRQCLARLQVEASKSLEDKHSGASVWLSELIWREFYQHVVAQNPCVSRGKCFAEWGERVDWAHDEILFERWKQGKTGFPIVDAAMRQLKETGWMHNRLRMIAACFLTKDLLIDWRWGERYFMSQLIDGDFAANNGGWQWTASIGTDAQPYFRVFNPLTQSKKFDPQTAFIRLYVKELESVPDKYLHEPHKWMDKHDVQLAYPTPIVDHQAARLRALEQFEEARAIDLKDRHEGKSR